MSETTDPRRPGGDISGPGGPFDVGGVVIDATDAVLVDFQEVSTVDMVKGGRATGIAVALLLAGRINKTEERARILFLLNADGVAALVTELIALAARAGDLMPGVGQRISERFAELERHQ